MQLRYLKLNDKIIRSAAVNNDKFYPKTLYSPKENDKSVKYDEP
jgi:hypothetical protein